MAEATITAGQIAAKDCQVTSLQRNAPRYATCDAQLDKRALKESWMTGLALDTTSDTLKYSPAKPRHLDERRRREIPQDSLHEAITFPPRFQLHTADRNSRRDGTIPPQQLQARYRHSGWTSPVGKLFGFIDLFGWARFDRFNEFGFVHDTGLGNVDLEIFRGYIKGWAETFGVPIVETQEQYGFSNAFGKIPLERKAKRDFEGACAQDINVFNLDLAEPDSGPD